MLHNFRTNNVAKAEEERPKNSWNNEGGASNSGGDFQNKFQRGDYVRNDIKSDEPKTSFFNSNLNKDRDPPRDPDRFSGPKRYDDGPSRGALGNSEPGPALFNFRNRADKPRDEPKHNGYARDYDQGRDSRDAGRDADRGGASDNSDAKKTSLKTNSTPYYGKQDDGPLHSHSDESGFRGKDSSISNRPPSNSNYYPSNSQTRQYGFSNNSQSLKPPSYQNQGRQLGQRGGNN